MSRDLFEEMIKTSHPDLFDAMQTEQFKLSDRILQYRVAHGIAIEEIASYLGMEVGDYHDFEYGTAEEDVSVYQNIYERLKECQKFHSQDYLFHNRFVASHADHQTFTIQENELPFVKFLNHFEQLKYIKQIKEGDDSWRATETMRSVTL